MRRALLLLAGLHACVAAGADPDTRWQGMQTAVLREQNLSQVESYLKAGFDPQGPIGCGTFDSLDGAVLNHNLDMVALLLRYGARPKESTFVDAAFLDPPEIAVRIVSAFLQAGSDANSKELPRNPEPVLDGVGSSGLAAECRARAPVGFPEGNLVERYQWGRLYAARDCATERQRDHSRVAARGRSRSLRQGFPGCRLYPGGQRGQHSNQPRAVAARLGGSVTDQVPAVPAFRYPNRRLRSPLTDCRYSTDWR
jgi:hypothetical protein